MNTDSWYASIEQHHTKTFLSSAMEKLMFFPSSSFLLFRNESKVKTQFTNPLISNNPYGGFMKRFTILFLVLAVLVTAVSFATAGEERAPKKIKSVGIPTRTLNTSDPLDGVLPNESGSTGYLARAKVATGRVLPTGGGLSGTYTIGVGGNYTTLGAAVADLQTSGVSGPTTFEFTDAAYTDTGGIVIGGYAGQGADNPVVFQLAEGNASAYITLSGGTAGNNFGIRILDASYVTWQSGGEPSPKGGPKPITIEVDTLSTARRVMQIHRSEHIKLADLVLVGWRRGSGSTGPVTALEGFNTLTPNVGNKYITIQNVHVMRCGFGMNFGGPTSTVKDSFITVEGCDFGGDGDFRLKVTTGIRMSNADNNVINQNDIRRGFSRGVAPEAFSVIGVDFTFGGLTNTYITQNYIHDFERAAGSGVAYGMYILNLSSPPVNDDNYRIFNNMIYDLRYNGLRSSDFQTIWGVAVWPQNGSIGAIRLYNNSIYLNDSVQRGWTAPIFYLGLTGDGFRNANNVLGNSCYTLPPYDATAHYVVDYAPCALISDANVYWADGATVTVSPDGGLAELQGACGDDAGSVAGNPGFVAPALHIDQTTVGFVSPAEALAFPLPYITEDIDKEERDLSTPDAGADEFTPIPWPHDAHPVFVTIPGTAGMPEGKDDIYASLRVRNNGDNTDDIPVRIIITDGETEYWNATATALGVPRLSNVDMSEEFGLIPALAVGSYDVIVITELSTDNDVANDTLYSTTVVINKFEGPYSTDFEDGGTGWLASSTGGNNDWVLGDPEKTVMDTAASGTNAWVTKFTGNYSDSHNGAVFSPFFDLSGMTSPIVKFKHIFATESEWDGGALEYSTDYGLSWTILGAAEDRYQWYPVENTTTAIHPSFEGSSTVYGVGYVIAAHDASEVAGLSQVRFRFRFASDSNTNDEGWVFDDFSIQEGATISGTVYQDDNGNGTQDEGEPGIEGVTVNLTGAEDVSTTSGTNGEYEVALFAEGNYDVTAASDGENTEPGEGGTYSFTYVKGTNEVANFGWYNPATVSGNVWHDANGNQAEDGGEGKLDSVLVTIGAYSAYSNVDGDYTVYVEEPGTYSMSASKDGYTTLFPKTAHSVSVTYGDAVTGKNYGLAGAAFAKSFRTATMSDWATAVDAKGKLKAIKCKADKVEFKFRLQAPAAATSVLVKIGQVSTGSVTDTAKNVIHTTWADAKEVTYTAAIDSAQWIQLEGWGTKGKVIKAKATWFKASDGKKVKVTPSEYILNNPRLPMPNLHNVGAELTFPITIGGASGAGSISHAAYKDVQKSLNKKGTLHANNVACLATFTSGKPIKKQLKSLPPDKADNKFFAEALTLALNLNASAAGKFPSGLDTLIIDEAGNIFNGMSFAQLLADANAALSCADTNWSQDTTGKMDSLYVLIKRINDEFAGTVDTVSWSCTSLEMTGVKTLKDVTWLRANPGSISPRTDPKPFSGQYEPEHYALQQNYPNPFNPTTTIAYDLVDDAIVTLKIYNMLGQEIATLVDNEVIEAGENEVDFDAAGMPSGVYFYRLNIQPLDEDGVAQSAISQVKKMMLLK
jgi:hypothetical protein